MNEKDGIDCRTISAASIEHFQREKLLQLIDEALDKQDQNDLAVNTKIKYTENLEEKGSLR